MERALINSVLTKFGVEQPERFDDDRAANKVKIRIAKVGVPADLTADEKAYVDGLGATAAKAPTVKAPAGKGAKGGKTAATAAKGGKAKTGKAAPAKAKGGKTATAKKPAAAKREGPSNSEIFRDMFPNKSTTVLRSDVFKKLEKVGAKHGTINSYISWAKRTKASKVKSINPWGFVLEETKNKDGAKVLKRV